MAIEKERGCGYRVVGGIYLVGGGLTVPCDRSPFNLKICPVCGSGIKFHRGFQWVDWFRYAGIHPELLGCKCDESCPVCYPKEGEKYGLMWVGSRYYTPNSFILETKRMGANKRIGHVPKELKVGETWVLLAHKKAGKRKMTGEELKEAKYQTTLTGKLMTECPAIFYAFKPTRIEIIITEKQSKNKKYMKSLERRGLTPVIVPDDDADHNPKLKKKRR